jgi:hypothetical protein
MSLSNPSTEAVAGQASLHGIRSTVCHGDQRWSSALNGMSRMQRLAGVDPFRTQCEIISTIAGPRETKVEGVRLTADSGLAETLRQSSRTNERADVVGAACCSRPNFFIESFV